ncbi:unnamed protein product [Prunus armeniaca]|uniref:DRBM domain-containing protein n=1 Tax=Prunus armeniaca TaxID=36596 RepID=A0A6J5UPP9_PRUAR|nr:unnamed protein product [Prunus armeniaca]
MSLVYGGSVKAPKILADTVESVAAAIYVDLNFYLEKLVDDVYLYLLLFVLNESEKLDFAKFKHVDIKHWRDERKSIANVYVDGEFVASGSSEHKEFAKLDAAKVAVDKLSPSMGVNDESFEGVVLMDGSFHIEEAKQKLHEICDQKKWPRPIYHIEKDEGPSHEKRFVSLVKIATIDGVLYMKGDEKSRERDAENSALDDPGFKRISLYMTQSSTFCI